MIPGGIADKLGNSYEAKWLVHILLKVISDKADWLNFESVETEYQGFEFAVARGDITEWHQTKVTAPTGNWTINALKTSGVLNAFNNRLSADGNAHCYFVSQDNAKAFRTLTEKSRISNSSSQLLDILSNDQNQDFHQLREEWRQPDEIVFEWLKRSFVVIFPLRELESTIESHGDLYFQNGGSTIFPILRDLLENNFNKRLTGDYIRKAIKKQGALKFKEWAFDPTIQQRLDEETIAYLQTYTPFGAGGETIERDHVSTILEEILKPDGAELVMLTGVAGSGKSGVIRGVIEQLRECNVPHLAFRVDHFLSSDTKEELGKKLTGRKESPVSTLKDTFPDTSSILFIDQVDAVSEVSGRDGQVKEVIFRLINDAHNFETVKIVVVCRTFDLGSDPRLEHLKNANRTITIDVPLLDWDSEVSPLLKNKGFDVVSMNEPQQKLLCLPINLSVFLEIDEPGCSFKSLSNLHEKLIEKKQRILTRERSITWPIVEPLTAMSEWMSTRQELSTPISSLDAYPGAVDILTSEGMIISSRGHLYFFHESFFDHVYARSFVNRDQCLVEILTETEQHLFRRTQVRQILEALRQNDFSRYLKELSSVLINNNIRFHIKTAISQWMSSIENPSVEEFEMINHYNESSGQFNRLFRSAVLSSHSWFDLLNKKNWVRQQIDSENEERAGVVLFWLSDVAGKLPKDVSELLREWWGKDPQRAERLLNWFGYVRSIKPDDNLLQLCLEVINSHPKNLFQDHQGRDRIMMFLDIWEAKSPELCGQILHSLFDAWFALNPGRNLFERDELKMIDTHTLFRIAERRPLALLQGITDTIVHLIELKNSEGLPGRSWCVFNHRTYSGYRYGFDELLGIYRDALKKIAVEDPETASTYLDKIDPSKHECLMHLHLEVIQTNPLFFAKDLPTLISNKMIFDAGWHGADWLSFAEACQTSIPYLGACEKDDLEQVILNYTPEIDLAIQYSRELHKNNDEEETQRRIKGVIWDLNQSGYKQWCILETIGEKLLSYATLSRLHELRRKFPDKKVEEPFNSEVYSVTSPIEGMKCSKMKDHHWISAIENYDKDEIRRESFRSVEGGARELASELQKVTKSNPARFSELCLKISYTAHQTYIQHILWGLTEAERLPSDSLAEVIKHAHSHPEKTFGSDIARLVEKHPNIATDPEILDILIWYALNGEAIESEDLDEKNTENETLSISALIRRGGSLHVRGINGARGSAWEAICSVLWKTPEIENIVWEALDLALDKEALISVRCCMMKSLPPLFNLNKENFSNSIRRITILPESASNQSKSMCLSPLITHTSINLFRYIFRQLPELADELISKLLECGDETKELIGAWLVFCESFANDEYIEKADKLSSVSVEHKRLLASVTGGAITWVENRYRGEQLLKAFFFDEDEEIRTNAAKAFRNVETKDVEQYRELASIFLKSPAFIDNGSAVLEMLGNANCDVLDLIADAAQQATDDINHHRNSMDMHRIQELLRREYTSSESAPEARKVILDLVDLMLSKEIYGVDSIVTAHDRW